MGYPSLNMQLYLAQYLRPLARVYNQQFISLYMSIDGAREDTTSGSGWIIATDTGQRIVHGYNSDYGKSEDIHSYRSEVYASLASLLFIHTYAEFYDISITNNISVLCDNKAYVKKLNEIITNPNYFKYIYKETEHEGLHSPQSTTNSTT